MTDSTFICGLMRANTNSLGFIPRPTIQNRFIPRGHYIIQRDRRAKPIGYLIHGPVHPDGTLYIHQTCIELDRRNRHFAHQALTTLLARALNHNAHRILLRCAADLPAVTFWAHLGFRATHISTGGRRRQRSIIHFRLDLTPRTVQPAPKVGFRLASCEPPSEGLTASKWLGFRGTAR